MKIILNTVNKEEPDDIDDFIDEELSPFQYHLERLRRFMTGTITLDFDEKRKIVLDIYYDLTVCFEEIVESVVLAKSRDGGKSIWFCEQGSDFYMDYTVKNDSISIAFRKGKSAGLPNREMDDFFVEVNKKDYIEEWQQIFKAIAGLFADKLNEKIDEKPF